MLSCSSRADEPEVSAGTLSPEAAGAVSELLAGADAVSGTPEAASEPVALEALAGPVETSETSEPAELAKLVGLAGLAELFEAPPCSAAELSGGSASLTAFPEEQPESSTAATIADIDVKYRFFIITRLLSGGFCI